MQLLSVILTLFLVMDPLGNIPFFISYLKDVKEGRKTWVVVRESLIALVLLLCFLFFGPMLMTLLHVGQESLHISGGVLLLLISLGMIFPGVNPWGNGDHDDTHVEPFIVPLAVPLFAGPSTMAAIMIFSSQSKQWEQLWLLFAALVIAWFLSTAILVLSPTLSRLLGKRGLRASERLMGMVLTVVAVQMFLDGVRLFLEGPA